MQKWRPQIHSTHYISIAKGQIVPAILFLYIPVIKCFTHSLHALFSSYTFDEPTDSSRSVTLPSKRLFVIVRTFSVRALVLTGIPALFIPGNAGSFRQCRAAAIVAVLCVNTCPPGRSTASIALEMHPAEFSHLKHFDFFTVNLNEVCVCV